jgi:GGDEF domain-containing protein
MSVDAATPAQLIRHADQAMYQAKASVIQRYFLHSHSSPVRDGTQPTDA